jgi:Ca-activated chloride channel homolog
MKCCRLLPAILILLITFSAWGQMWVRSIEIPCSVTDQSGQFVVDLTKNDFVVRDNGNIQKVTDVKQKVQSPLRLALLLDRSASVRDSFALLKEASQNFLASVIRPNVDQACLIAFDSHVYLLQDWTSDVPKLSEMIRQLDSAGGTSLFDAIYKTSRDEFSSPDENSSRAIVLVTDGEDTDSQATFSQVRDMITQSGAMVYVLGVHAESSLNPRALQGKKVLSELKDITGGNVFYLHEGENVHHLFDQMQNELRNQYIVTFTTYDKPDGKMHHLKLEAHRKGLQIHTHKDAYIATS